MEVFRKFILATIFFFIIIKQRLAHNQDPYTTKITSFVCSGSTKFASIISCKLKPVRNGIGILYFQAKTKQSLDDVWFQINLYYKFGTQYRQWLVSFDINFCEELQGPTTSIIGKMVVDSWKRMVPKEFYSCPLSGFVDGNFNSDNSSDNIFYSQFPRLPQGEFKLIYYAHTARNETLWSYEIKFQVKSKNGVTKTTMLTMG